MKEFNRSEWDKPRTPRQQVYFMSRIYLRHGGKGSRKKLVSRLANAVEDVCAKFRLTDVEQIGKKQIKWSYEQLRQAGRSDRTLSNYYYAWAHLWEMQGRRGTPPRPRMRGND